MAHARTILIAGAGLAGLAGAISLARAGLRPLVIERAKQFEEAGAGIQLTPNATAALDKLGILPAVRQRAVEAKALIVADGESGRELARAPLGDAQSRYGAPWLLTHRADLHRALRSAAEELVDIEFALGAEVKDFALHARGVTALTMRGGQTEEQIGIAFVGADGLWSEVRARLHGESEPDFPGFVAWRALVPASSLPASFAEPVVWLWLGPGAHVVHYPVAGGELVNLVAIFRDDWRAQGWNVAADASQFPKACERWSEIPRRVIAAAKSFGRWPLADRAPLKTWGDGRVTLIGDAAHPMLPFLAQGAAAAFEDAVTLGRHVRQTEDLASAFRAYEAERAPRAARLQGGARFNARVYHACGPLRWARDLKLNWDAEKIIARHDWIYRHRAA